MRDGLDRAYAEAFAQEIIRQAGLCRDGDRITFLAGVVAAVDLVLKLGRAPGYLKHVPEGLEKAAGLCGRGVGGGPPPPPSRSAPDPPKLNVV